MIIKVQIYKDNKFETIAIGEYNGEVSAIEKGDTIYLKFNPAEPSKVGGLFQLNKVEIKEFKLEKRGRKAE
ncbi:MAG: hypothetical protein QXX03_05595 [Nitrososphaerota archaeon]